MYSTTFLFAIAFLNFSLADFNILDLQKSLHFLGKSAEAIAKEFKDPNSKGPEFNEAVQLYCMNPVDKTYRQTYLNDPEIKNKINFDYEVVYIIHGWVKSANEQWVLDVATNVMQYQKINVCRVNWADLASVAYEIAATENTLIVGKAMTDFIIFLGSRGGPTEQTTTLVGHSLGAHICGFIGSNLGGSKIKKIFGLDPAGILFLVPHPLPINYRLDPKDAAQVIVIHTNDKIIGSPIQMGHQDFYPNGGASIQPGCLFESYSRYGVDPITCSHHRSIEIFSFSLKPTSKYVGVNCRSYEEYFSRKCNLKDTNKLEWDVDYSKKGRYYFSTTENGDSTGGFW